MFRLSAGLWGVAYQLAFFTPGILPSFARTLKQIRHTLNLRYTACDRPHISHRVYWRTRNFGFCFALNSNAFVDILLLLTRHGRGRAKAYFTAAAV
jgi:hypothetical protein